MRAFLLTACLACCVATFATGEVSITKSPTGWELTNGHIRVELARSSGAVELRSLRREGGNEWAVAGTPLVAIPDKAGSPYRYSEDIISDLAAGGKQLILRFLSDAGALLSLELKLYPTGAVIQTAMHLENRGQHSLLLTLSAGHVAEPPFQRLSDKHLQFHGVHPFLAGCAVRTTLAARVL